jgi:hypothetical protein
MAALTILINIIVFSKIMFFTSLLIEKVYGGKYKHLVFIVLTVLMIGLALRTEFVIMVLNAFLSDFSIRHLALIIAGGIMSSVFISFFCIFFRYVQLVLVRLVSH